MDSRQIHCNTPAEFFEMVEYCKQVGLEELRWVGWYNFLILYKRNAMGGNHSIDGSFGIVVEYPNVPPEIYSWSNQ